MITYHKSQIIPADQSTTVYWWSDNEGNEGDIPKEQIPKGAKIIDETYSSTAPPTEEQP